MADIDDSNQDAPTQDPDSRNPNPDSRLVPVAESIKYRRRAQTAEGRLQEFQQQVEQLHAQLDQGREQIATAEAQRDEAQHQLQSLENRLTAERMLTQAGVIDVEAAYLLLSKRVNLQEQADQAAIESGIEQLLIDKPFLQGTRAQGGQLPPKSATARQQPGLLSAHLAQAAQRAIRSGGRRDIAEYLRLRRQASLARDRRQR